jgi:hypothetical protein
LFVFQGGKGPAVIDGSNDQLLGVPVSEGRKPEGGGDALPAVRGAQGRPYLLLYSGGNRLLEAFARDAKRVCPNLHVGVRKQRRQRVDERLLVADARRDTNRLKAECTVFTSGKRLSQTHHPSITRGRKFPQRGESHFGHSDVFTSSGGQQRGQMFRTRLAIGERDGGARTNFRFRIVR